MIHDLSTTTTFPDFNDPDRAYTLDDVYWEAQDSLWTIYFGTLINWALFACLIIQVYFYFINFPKDRRLIKGTVLLLFLIEIGDTAFLTWTGFVSQIRQWGHNIVFPPGIYGSMIFDCLVASVVHALYAWRIHKLIVRRWLAIGLTLLIMLLSMAQVSCCFAGAMFFALQEIQGPSKQFVARKLFHGWLTTATSADLVITIVMAFKLYSARTGVRSTDRAINKLLYVTIPGGAFTAMVTMMILIIQLRFVGTSYYQFLLLPLTKFYSNSVLVCLNLRSSNVNGIGRHTMLTGFQTDQQISTSRLPFDIKVDRNVEKSTSSGILFQSDPAYNSSDYGLVEETRTIVHTHDNHLYPITIQTMPLQSTGYRSMNEKANIVAAVDQIAPMELSCDGHPFRSSDCVTVDAPKYLRSVSSVLSTQATRGHDMDDKQTSLSFKPRDSSS